MKKGDHIFRTAVFGLRSQYSSEICIFPYSEKIENHISETLHFYTSVQTFLTVTAFCKAGAHSQNPIVKICHILTDIELYRFF